MQKVSIFCLLFLAFSASAESLSFLQQTQITISPKILDFGTIEVGSMEGKTVSVTNIGSVPVVLSGAGGGAGEPFIAYQDCQGVTLQPGSSCYMYYNFTPVTAGPVNVVVGGSWNEVEYHLLLKANATGEEPPITISPTSFDFGTVQVGDRIKMTANVTNAGNRSVVMVGAGGSVDAPFSFAQNCESLILGAGESCQMSFYFTPTTDGPASAVSQGTWNGQSFNITLTGTGNGTQPNITLSPSSLDFGDVELGDTKEMFVNVTNNDDRPLVLDGTEYNPGGPFGGYVTCEGVTLNPGESCQMLYTFSPSADGNATAIAEGNWNGQPFQIPLSGNGIGILPNITISPTSLDFGDVKVGTSKVLTVDITNYSERSLVMTGAGGGLAAPFEVSQNCVEKTLNPGQSCMMFFNFTPTSTGPVNAVSSGNWNTANYEIEVKGNGVQEELLIA